MKQLIKSAIMILSIALTSILLFDVFAYWFFPNLVRRVEPEYARSLNDDFPNGLFENNKSRGFDLSRGFLRKVNYPYESEPYEIRVNNLGCFDDDYSSSEDPVVYLAGDSFTFGFAPFDKKFGTLLEDALQLRVLKCGVSHTGQRHQYSKFTEIYNDLPKKPRIVVVNYVDNDIQNDYAFPHSRVVDGYMVDEAVFRYEDSAGRYVLYKKSQDELVSGLNARLNQEKGIKKYLIRHSATANLIRNLKRIAYHQAADNPAEAQFYQLFGKTGTAASPYPIYSKYGQNNREALKIWAKHSRENGYILIVSLIPPKNSLDSRFYDEVKDFLSKNGISWADFGSYIVAHDVDIKSIFWKHDIHFNYLGNKVYADFLKEVLEPYLKVTSPKLSMQPQS